MKYLLLVLLSAVQAHALECTSTQDPSYVVSVMKNPPPVPAPIIEFGLRNHTMRLYYGGSLVKEELVSFSLGLASNFFIGDTLFLDDGMFKGEAHFADRAQDIAFPVKCSQTGEQFEF